MDRQSISSSWHSRPLGPAVATAPCRVNHVSVTSRPVTLDRSLNYPEPSFIICIMGIITKPASLGCCENYRGQHLRLGRICPITGGRGRCLARGSTSKHSPSSSRRPAPGHHHLFWDLSKTQSTKGCKVSGWDRELICSSDVV